MQRPATARARLSFPAALGVALLAATLLPAPSSRAQGDDWRHDEPCGERMPAMGPIATSGFHRYWCAQTGLGRLCAGVKEDADETYFSLERVGGAREDWKVASVPPLGGDASHFRIDRVGDGRLFFAMMRSESVGIAVSDWAVWAIGREKVSNPLEVQNYGILSYATRARRGAPCQLLAARWHSGWEPGRGHGMYIAGSWYEVERGAFVRVFDRPVVYVRYLFGVERARYDAESREQPLLWFRHPAVTVTTGPRPVTGKEPWK